MGAIWKAVRWALGEVWEKVNIVGTYRELVRLGKKHGRRFFWAAIVWELIEDGLFPLLSWWAGVPELIPLFLIFHFEPIAYPAIFWGFRMYDRARGREPWEPDRSVRSSYWRSVSKVVVYKLAITGWFLAILLKLHIPLTALAAYVGLMALFGFIHERIWHDTNFGIRSDDTVEFKRTLSKAMTYRIVSAMTMYPLLKVLLASEGIWPPLVSCQAVGFVLYLALELIWSRSGWGTSPVKEAAAP